MLRAENKVLTLSSQHQSVTCRMERYLHECRSESHLTVCLENVNDRSDHTGCLEGDCPRGKHPIVSVVISGVRYPRREVDTME